MHIRPYRADDMAELAELFTMAVHILGRPHYDEAQRAAWAPIPPDLEYWATRFGALHTLVMEDAAGCPLGFISWRRESDSSAYISLIFVRPDAVRKGIASRLLSAAEAALAGVTQLHVHASRIARPFFEHNGYQLIAEEVVIRAAVALPRYAMRKDRSSA